MYCAFLVCIFPLFHPTAVSVVKFKYVGILSTSVLPSYKDEYSVCESCNYKCCYKLGGQTNCIRRAARHGEHRFLFSLHMNFSER